MRTPGIFHLKNLLDSTNSLLVLINGKWIPSRPETGMGLRYRLKAAWMVFTGKADALIWPEGQ